MFEHDPRVGPVLSPGTTANAIVAAIRELNEGVEISDRGGYLRVLCPRRCLVTRTAVEAYLGQPFPLPGGLELVMPSFQGSFSVSESEAEWIL